MTDMIMVEIMAGSNQATPANMVLKGVIMVFKAKVLILFGSLETARTIIIEKSSEKLYGAGQYILLLKGEKEGGHGAYMTAQLIL